MAPSDAARRSLAGLELATFVAVAVVAVLRTPAAVGWDGGAAAAGVAGFTATPGHGAGAVVLGALAGLIPVGDFAFRLALVGALALAAAAAGVVALARALVPTAAAAGVIAAALLAISPAAAATSGAGLGAGAVAAALAVWVLVLVVRQRRQDQGEWNAANACAASAMVGALATVAPLVALVVAVPVVMMWWCVPLRRRALGLVPAGVAFGLIVIPVLARGEPVGAWVLVGGGEAAGARIVALAGDGTGVVLMFAGLVGLGLGAATGLRGAGMLLGVAMLAGAAVALASPASFTLVPLAFVAAGVGPLAAAIARLGPSEHRPLIATIAAVPVAAIAAVAPVRAADGPADAEDATTRVAADLLGPVRGGPGVFVATEPAIHDALVAEQALAGLRRDLVVVPNLSGRGLAVELQAKRAVAADRASFGALDPRRSLPAGRAFELLATEPADDAPATPPPAVYPGRTGRALAAFLATERARREAARGHLDRAARAAGLAGSRFGAADLALLAATTPSKLRPALFGFIPPLSAGALPPPWLPELFGDDLAWVAGLGDAPLAADAPPERRLHALWRDVLAGRRAPDDAAIIALGLAAGRATARMLADLDRLDASILAADATLKLANDPPTLLVLGSALAARGGVADHDTLDEVATNDLRAAEIALGRAVAADERLADAHVLLGLVQARLGRRAEARATWQRGLAAVPGHPELVQLVK